MPELHGVSSSPLLKGPASGSRLGAVVESTISLGCGLPDLDDGSKFPQKERASSTSSTVATSVSWSEGASSNELDFMAVNIGHEETIHQNNDFRNNGAINIPRVQTLGEGYGSTDAAAEGGAEMVDKMRRPFPRFEKPNKYGPRRISEQLHANRAEGKVYGQWEERDQLVNILKRSGKQSKVDVVLISGPLGVGKTALARTLKNPMVLHEDGTPDPDTRPCFFLEAKFEHLRSPNPYQIFLDIFEEFAEQVLLHPDIRKYSKAIWCAVYEDMDMVVNLIPPFRKVLTTNYCDLDSSSTQSSGSDSQTATASGALMAQRVTALFVTLLQTIASVTPRNPLVVCLDDLHWASETSLDTLVCLIKDMDVHSAGSVIFVANRRNCIAKSCPTVPWQEKLSAAGTVQIHNIQMKNLKEIDVTNILKDTLHSRCHTLDPIGSLVHSLTQGNPMFIAEVLRTLQDEGLIYVSEGCPNSRRWECDIPKTHASLGGMTNVFDLISKKLRKLPPCTLRTLMRASCLGSSLIDESILQLLEPLNARKCLEHNVEAGYLRKHADGGYRFVSDGVQYCIYHLLPEEERAAFHLEIAQVLWSHLEERKDKEFLFLLLNQLMLGDSLLKEDSDRLAVATLCLRAGESSAKKLGFQTAWVYLSHGLSLLPGNRMWGRDSYDLSLRLHNAAIEVCYCNAQFDILDNLIGAILKNSRVFDDSLLARSTQIYALGSRNKLEEAVNSAIATLKELGEIIPINPKCACVRNTFCKSRRQLNKMSDEQILALDRMTDRNYLAKMQIFNHMFLYAYYSRPKLAAFVASRMVQITLKYGISAISAVAFTFYGQFLCSSFCVKEGYRFGNLSLRLYEKFGNEAWLSRVWSFYYGTVATWKEPFSSLVGPLKHGYNVGLRTGDIEYALLNGSYLCWNSIETLPLPQLKIEIQKVVTTMKNTGHTMALAMLQPLWNLVLNFTCSPESEHRRDEFLHLVEKETQTALESSNQNVVLWFRVTTVISAYIYGDYELGEKHISGIQELYWYSKYCGAGAASVLFFECMTMLALIQKRAWISRIRDLSYVQKRIRLLEEWAHECPENLLAKLHLLKGEFAVVRGDCKKACQHFRAGILHAQSEGHHSSAALGKERLGIFLAGQGERDKASKLLEEAAILYEKWGAQAKASKLQKFRRKLLPDESEVTEAVASTQSSWHSTH